MSELIRILVVDDDPDASALLAHSFSRAGFAVSTAANGEEALEKAKLESPALVTLDLMLPGLSGFEVCRILRGDPHTAGIQIMMVTGKSDEVDRIVGFELGADDYVVKPFSPREVVLRAKAILKRRMVPVNEPRLVCVGPIQLNHELYEVRVNGKYCDLTPTEFKLLATLAERPWKVHSREQLLNEIWGYACTIETRTVDAHMRRLRDKLYEAAELIITVRGLGYRLIPGPPEEQRQSA